MAEAPPWIAIVDDDPGVLRALSRLLRSRALHAKSYASALEFLAALPDGLPECLIVDLHMPEMDGLQLHQHLISNGVAIPTILITAYDKAINLPPVRDRFVARLQKPFQDDTLLSAVAAAIGAGGRRFPRNRW